MADEKNGSEVDDWLDDIEDGDVTSSNLDQLDLDSLLDKDENSSDGEDVELDQSNIDALFDSVDGSSAAEHTPENNEEDLDQTKVDSLLNSDGGEDTEQAEEAAELDQAGIDDLFESAGDKEESPTQEANPEESNGGDDGAELDQADIDNMLASEGDKEESPAQEATPEESSSGDDGAELDQADIDDMFASEGGEEEDPAQEATPEESSSGDDGAELDQADIDDMFASEGGEEESPAQETAKAVDNEGKKPAQQETAEDEPPAGESFASELDDMEDFFSDLEDEDSKSSGEPFEAEDLDFSDMLDNSTGAGAAESDESGDGESTVGMTSEYVSEAVAAAQEEEPQKSGFILSFLPDSLNNTLVAGIALGLLVILVGSWLFLRSGDKEVIPPITEQQPVTEKKPAANSIPVAHDGVYAMGEKAGEIQISLAGEDNDTDPLTFKITSPPSNGILSGNPPELTYLPNKTFSGEDHFEFKVSDGKEESGTASVVITGPDLAKPAEPEERKKENPVILPKKPVIMARDVNLRVLSTDEAVIDWAGIWRRANRTAFNDKIYVDIDQDGLRGKIKRMNSGQSRYIPDKFFQGREIIRYRFKRGGISSATGRIEMRVALGTPPPEIHFNNLARNYFVGERVIIDAGPTRDEHRNSVKFSWKQLAGPPVNITPLNQEGSIISFVMPSSFSGRPGPCLRLTAVDDMGQSVTSDLEMTPVSRRQTALWRGTGDGLAPDPVMDKRMLPWPY